jgi:hypothetical protein
MHHTGISYLPTAAFHHPALLEIFFSISSSWGKYSMEYLQLYTWYWLPTKFQILIMRFMDHMGISYSPTAFHQQALLVIFFSISSSWGNHSMKCLQLYIGYRNWLGQNFQILILWIMDRMGISYNPTALHQSVSLEIFFSINSSWGKYSMGCLQLYIQYWLGQNF